MYNETMKDLIQNARDIMNIHFTQSQIEALEIYERELLVWNTHTNLTAIRDPKQIRIKHFLDSLTCLQVMKDTPIENVIDVGTGAGFPGLPLKILNSSIRLTLVESVGKKVNFCQHIIEKLELENVEIIQERVEVLGHNPEHRQKYDWAIARSVAILPVLVEYLLPLVRLGGAMLAMKGETAPGEVHTAEYATHLLGGRLRKLHPVILPGVVEKRYLVVLDKIAATPAKYPRRVGIPTKNPLKISESN